MLLQTILHRVQQIKGFVYGRIRFGQWEGDPTLEVEVRPRKGSRGVCSGCGKKAPRYDRVGRRRVEFVPFWGVRVFLNYRPRRVNCPRCGVKVERVPWAEGKAEVTTAYRWFLAGWAKRLSWQEVAEAFHSSWHQVSQAVEMAVEWGKSHRNREGIRAIGIDEIQCWLGHKYVTLVYQLDGGCRRLLWVGEKRKAKTLLKFFHWLGAERTARLQFICSDMWKAYLKAVKKKAGQATHILDRFHIVAHLNQAIDEVRAGEARQLKQAGKGEVLKRSRWLFLKRPERLKEEQGERLAELVRHNLRTVRAYICSRRNFSYFGSIKGRDGPGVFWTGGAARRCAPASSRSRKWREWSGITGR